MKVKKSVPYQYVLFDLDDTLYPRAAGLMNVIGDRILQYMTHRVGIPADDAPLKKGTIISDSGPPCKA